eukprot:scaffold107915_cov30-Tisochrysis_lutea.AAC.1
MASARLNAAIASARLNAAIASARLQKGSQNVFYRDAANATISFLCAHDEAPSCPDASQRLRKGASPPSHQWPSEQSAELVDLRSPRLAATKAALAKGAHTLARAGPAKSSSYANISMVLLDASVN